MSKLSAEIVENSMREAQLQLRAAAKDLRLAVHYLPAGEPIDAIYHTRRALSATQAFFERLEEEREDEDED